jgi:glycosyltransferase involved in cell wall biosynthesis
MEEENWPVVGVVVTTKNEEKNIENCLKSIKSQTYPQEKIEIIVVDNNSTDRTKEIAARYTEKVYNFGPERSAQLNFGVRLAKGKYILFPDTDMILSENVIAECVEKCLPCRKPKAFLRGEKEGYIALYIPEKIVNLSSNHLNNLCNLNFNLRNQRYWIKVRDFERSFYNATVIDCARFVRRDKFLEIGGFDESLTGPEDWNKNKLETR